MNIHDQTTLQCIILFNKEHGQNQNKWSHSVASYIYLCQVLKNKDTNFSYSDDSRSMAYHIEGNGKTIFLNHHQACEYIVYDTEIHVLNTIYEKIKKQEQDHILNRINKLESIIRPKLDSFDKTFDLHLMRLLVKYVLADKFTPDDCEEFEKKVINHIKKTKVDQTMSLALNMCVIS